jgi:hypothetical protein
MWLLLFPAVWSRRMPFLCLLLLLRLHTLLACCDDPANMNSSRIWMFTGTKDTVVVSGVIFKAVEYYQQYVSNYDQIKLVSNVPAEHSWVTSSYGNKCDYEGSPYVNNCGFDGSGEFLKHWFPDQQLAGPVDKVDANVRAHCHQN